MVGAVVGWVGVAVGAVVGTAVGIAVGAVVGAVVDTVGAVVGVVIGAVVGVGCSDAPSQAENTRHTASKAAVNKRIFFKLAHILSPYIMQNPRRGVQFSFRRCVSGLHPFSDTVS